MKIYTSQLKRLIEQVILEANTPEISDLESIFKKAGYKVSSPRDGLLYGVIRDGKWFVQISVNDLGYNIGDKIDKGKRNISLSGGYKGKRRHIVISGHEVYDYIKDAKKTLNYIKSCFDDEGNPIK